MAGGFLDWVNSFVTPASSVTGQPPAGIQPNPGIKAAHEATPNPFGPAPTDLGPLWSLLGANSASLVNQIPAPLRESAFGQDAASALYGLSDVVTGAGADAWNYFTKPKGEAPAAELPPPQPDPAASFSPALLGALDGGGSTSVSVPFRDYAETEATLRALQGAQAGNPFVGARDAMAQAAPTGMSLLGPQDSWELMLASLGQNFNPNVDTGTALLQMGLGTMGVPAMVSGANREIEAGNADAASAYQRWLAGQEVNMGTQEAAQGRQQQQMQLDIAQALQALEEGRAAQLTPKVTDKTTQIPSMGADGKTVDWGITRTQNPTEKAAAFSMMMPPSNAELYDILADKYPGALNTFVQKNSNLGEVGPTMQAMGVSKPDDQVKASFLEAFAQQEPKAFAQLVQEAQQLTYLKALAGAK